MTTRRTTLQELLVMPPLVFTDGRWIPVVQVAGPPPSEVRLVTWNVWFGPHAFAARGHALLAELERRRPDVVVLQEVTLELLGVLTAAPWIRAEYQLSDADGVTIDGYGVVLMSRIPIRKVRIAGLPTLMGRRLVVGELACGLTIATVHLESTRARTASRVRQLELIQPYLASLGPDVILAGDMNFSPDDPAETAVLDAAFVDAWPAVHPDEPGYSIDGTVNTMRHDLPFTRSRIDRIFARGRWRPTTIDLVGTTPIGPDTFVSDHFGLAATLAAPT